MVRIRFVSCSCLLAGSVLLAGCDRPSRTAPALYASDRAPALLPHDCSAQPPRALDPLPVIPAGFRRRGASESPDLPDVSLGDPAIVGGATAELHPPLDTAPLLDTAPQLLDASGSSPAAAEVIHLPAAADFGFRAPAMPGKGPIAAMPTHQPTVSDHSRDLLPAVQRLPAEPTSTALPWAVRQPRTPQLDAVAACADHTVERGFRLAERGAVYSARADFYEALSSIARAHDIQQQTGVYSRALAAGRLALRESHDFVRPATLSAQPSDLMAVVATHRTPILVRETFEHLGPVVARNRYLEYAQEQLAFAAGGEPAASRALYGLGKTTLGERSTSSGDAAPTAGEAMACFQAALRADGRNFRAAHELAVLVAEDGRPELARELCVRSLAIAPQAATWQNLATIHRRLGENDLANRAQRNADTLKKSNPNSLVGSNIRWVDPATFARSVSPSEGLMPPTAAIQTPSEAAPPPANTVQSAPAGKRRTALIMPWPRTPQR